MKRKQLIFILIASLVSLINTMTLAAAMIVVAANYCWTERSAGAIKALLFITLRCIISTGIAATPEGLNILKWCLLFGLSIFAVLFRPKRAERSSVQFLLLLALFSVFVIATSFLVGSYPTVSLFKVLSWSVIFGCVVYSTYNDPANDWLEILRLSISTLIVLSLFTIPLDVGYLRNGKGFQGITNHPNMFGVMCALCFALNLPSEKKLTISRLAMLAICVLCAFLSQSRTGMFSIVLLLAYALITSEMNLSDKIISITGLTIFVVMAVTVYLLNDPDHTSSIWSFIFKGHEENILYSRDSQAEALMERFVKGPIIGTGFMVPYTEGVRSFGFSFSVSVEPGNIAMMLLSHTGIIGTLLFLALFGYLFYYTPKKKRVIFVMPILLSMGEMAFFSSNNIAILYYIIYGVCFSPCGKQTENKRLKP